LCANKKGENNKKMGDKKLKKHKKREGVKKLKKIKKGKNKKLKKNFLFILVIKLNNLGKNVIRHTT